MYVKTVELKNFRNYEYLKIDFHKGINMIYGDNAQGKTNILEAVYMASTTKSHRCLKDDELIRFNDNDVVNECECENDNKNAHIKVLVEKEFTSNRVDIHIKKNKPKGIAVDGFPLKKATDLFGILQVVFFCPEDMDIIRRGPCVRRHFIDIDISRMDKLYLNSIMDYNRILESRNKLLKKMMFSASTQDFSTLDVIDCQFVKYGVKVIEERKLYLGKLNEITSKIHLELTAGKEKLELVYLPASDEKSLENELAGIREKDLKTGISNTGPHRDDFTFFINGADAKKYASQGQKRTIALSLKLAETEIIKNITKETPILLLDDVLSELDVNRQEYLMDKIGDIQTIITCTGRDDLIMERIKIDKIFNVDNAKVKEIL